MSKKIPAPKTGLHELPIAHVYPNPDQPRKEFREEELRELAESIRVNGLMQPIKVRPDGDGYYLIVAGERRWRAHRLLGAATIKAIVEELTDDQVADQAIIENLQRLDITPLEEAAAFKRRLDQGVQLHELAQRLGVLPSRIEKRVALLNLAPEYRDAFAHGLLEQNEVNHLARLTPAYQRLLFDAIRGGRCKTRPALRALADALVRAESEAKGEPPPATLQEANVAPEQGSMFADVGPSHAERAALTAFEKKVAAISELVQAGFEDQEVVVVRKVSAAHASSTADKLELLEAHLRKMRIALRKAAAVSAA